MTPYPRRFDCRGKTIEEVLDWVEAVSDDIMRANETEMLVNGQDIAVIDAIADSNAEYVATRREDLRRRILAISAEVHNGSSNVQ